MLIIGRYGNVVSTWVNIRYAKWYSVASYQESRVMHVTPNGDSKINQFEKSQSYLI